MVGTAPRVDRWLLVEHPGPWAVDALAGSGVALDVAGRLRAAAAGVRGRIVLVRRPGRGRREHSRSWLVVDSLAGTVTRGRWRQDDDLLRALPALAGRADDGSHELVLLVCAHGRHDTCCAVRGRPVAAVLAQRWPGATWECSHVGGDRFAPNVVVLPDGFYYGGLDPVSAREVVDAHVSGAVDARYLRGMCGETQVAQAAVAAAYRRLGPAPAGTVRATGCSQDAEGRWLVALTTPVGPMSAVVATSLSEPARLTCRATRDARVTRYEVTGITPR
jgi:hypothetical protein